MTLSAFLTFAAGLALGAPLWAAVGAIIASIGGIMKVGFVYRQAILERRRESALVDRYLLTPVAPVVEVDPTHIGVEAAAQCALPGGRIPEYVQRSKDAELKVALKAAVTGDGPGIVVVQGPSKVGKSRSMFEIVRRSVDGGWTPHLVAPVDGAALTAILTPGEEPTVCAEHAVLWLDDLEIFLNSGVDLRTLREWLKVADGRVVVATYGGKGSQLVGDTTNSKLSSVSQEVLQHAAVITLEETSQYEVAGLRDRLSAEVLAAVNQYGLAAFLVAGPLLARKLKTRHLHPGEREFPEGVACVHVVADWARCGRSDPIPIAALMGLWAKRCPGAEEDEFDEALRWALTPVAGSIALLSRTDDGVVPFDFTVRLVAQAPGAATPTDESWDAAIATAEDEVALDVGERCYGENRLQLASRAFRRAAKSDLLWIAVIAKFNAAVVLGDQGQTDGEIAAYDAILAQHGNDHDPAVREQVAKAMFNKGGLLWAMERFTEAIESYDDVVARYGNDPEPALREQVAGALVNKGGRLGEMRLSVEALEAYDEVVARYGNDIEPALRTPVARARYNKGVRLGILGRHDEAIAAYDDVFARYGNDPEPVVRIPAAMALGNKADQLSESGLPEEAIEVYDEVVSRYGNDPEPALRTEVAKALFNKGGQLGESGLPEEAIEVYDDVIARYGNDPEPALRAQVAKALVNKGSRLGQLELYEEAVDAWNDVVARYGNDTEPDLRAQVANALFNRGIVLEQLGRTAQGFGV